ncbi:sigma-70 family RNA polymerase sigma factor [Arthrobacter sp. MI7-26]|uniref:RNA polymerase sigma factor n=1 Tax=Arthrobacter sp. MI7-26 TaxID=2993653 RepID=UPI0022490317|nr:sigma-70 family RNA polymerase sigma factor [Arthrobacter sp. MI7-26]MCX2748027.1 sigma-70 family RNA polymerase sigma factor [Arthrobacter sp. MI7-26]
MRSEGESTFIALHRDTYPRIFRFVRRRVDDPQVAEELAADVFRVAWQKWDEASSVDVAWLFTVARNLLGNAYRSHQRQLALHERLRESVVPGDGAGSRYSLVDEVLDSLREKDRDILQLAYWDQLTVAEIAAVLQCGESAAKVRLHRAREAFRKLLPANAGAVAEKLGA